VTDAPTAFVINAAFDCVDPRRTAAFCRGGDDAGVAGEHPSGVRGDRGAVEGGLAGLPEPEFTFEVDQRHQHRDLGRLAGGIGQLPAVHREGGELDHGVGAALGGGALVDVTGFGGEGVDGLREDLAEQGVDHPVEADHAVDGLGERQVTALMSAYRALFGGLVQAELVGELT
jgi:hypothetical protein